MSCRGTAPRWCRRTYAAWRTARRRRSEARRKRLWRVPCVGGGSGRGRRMGRWWLCAADVAGGDLTPAGGVAVSLVGGLGSVIAATPGVGIGTPAAFLAFEI